MDSSCRYLSARSSSRPKWLRCPWYPPTSTKVFETTFLFEIVFVSHVKRREGVNKTIISLCSMKRWLSLSLHCCKLRLSPCHLVFPGPQNLIPSAYIFSMLALPIPLVLPMLRQDMQLVQLAQRMLEEVC